MVQLVVCLRSKCCCTVASFSKTRESACVGPDPEMVPFRLLAVWKTQQESEFVYIPVCVLASLQPCLLVCSLALSFSRSLVSASFARSCLFVCLLFWLATLNCMLNISAVLVRVSGVAILLILEASQLLPLLDVAGGSSSYVQLMLVYTGRTLHLHHASPRESAFTDSQGV